MSDRAIFLSIKPHFASQILEGKKGVELRRKRPKASVGTLIVLYASSPVRQIVGTCRVTAIESDRPDWIWHRLGLQTGLEREDFFTYFAGAEKATAISVGDPVRTENAPTLSQIRKMLPGFRPPQSWRYLEPSDTQTLVGSREARRT